MNNLKFEELKKDICSLGEHERMEIRKVNNKIEIIIKSTDKIVIDLDD